MLQQGGRFLHCEERGWRIAGAVALVALLALATHARSLDLGFVNWDDRLYLTDNPDVRYPTPGGLVHLFHPRSLVVQDWTPLVTVSFALEYSVFGLNPRGYHATNWILHAATAGLVVLLFVQVGASPLLAVGAGALFAVHPLQVESVAWVSARKNLLALLFGLGSLIVYIRSRTGRAYLVSLLLFGLALASKGTAVVVPLWLLAYRLTVAREGKAPHGLKAELPTLALGLAPFFLLALARGLWSVYAQSDAIGNTGPLGLGGRMAVMGPVFVTYLRQLFWPEGLSGLYPWAPLAATEPRVLAAWGLIALAAGLTVAWARRDRRVAFAALLATASMVPTANVIAAPYFQADRYMHLSMVGVAYLTVAGAAGLVRAFRLPRAAAPILLGAWMGLLLVPATWARTGVWKSSCTFWRVTQARVPSDPLARTTLADCLLGEEDREGAERELRKALALEPRRAETWESLGLFLLSRDRPEQARPILSQAATLAPEKASMHDSLATLHYRVGELAEAEASWRQAVELDPEKPRFHVGLGLVLMDQKRVEEAERWLRPAVARWQTAGLHNNLAWLLIETGRLEEGLLHARRAVTLQPDLAEAWDTLGVGLARSGQQAEAREALERALALDPDLEVVRDHQRTELNP